MKPGDGGLLPLTSEEAYALTSIKKSSQWPVIREWLSNSLIALAGNAYPDDYMARWSQGNGQSIKKLMNSVDSSEEIYRELEDIKKRKEAEAARQELDGLIGYQ